MILDLSPADGFDNPNQQHGAYQSDQETIEVKAGNASFTD